MDDIFSVLKGLRDLPRTAKAAVTEACETVGIETFPEVHAIVKKNDAGKWELVAVSLDPALLPLPEPDAFLLSARLGKP